MIINFEDVAMTLHKNNLGVYQNYNVHVHVLWLAKLDSVC